MFKIYSVTFCLLSNVLDASEGCLLYWKSPDRVRSYWCLRAIYWCIYIFYWFLHAISYMLSVHTFGIWNAYWTIVLEFKGLLACQKKYTEHIMYCLNFLSYICPFLHSCQRSRWIKKMSVYIIRRYSLIRGSTKLKWSYKPLGKVSKQNIESLPAVKPTLDPPYIWPP